MNKKDDCLGLVKELADLDKTLIYLLLKLAKQK